MLPTAFMQHNGSSIWPICLKHAINLFAGQIYILLRCTPFSLPIGLLFTLSQWVRLKCCRGNDWRSRTFCQGKKIRPNLFTHGLAVKKIGGLPTDNDYEIGRGTQKYARMIDTAWTSCVIINIRLSSNWFNNDSTALERRTKSFLLGWILTERNVRQRVQSNSIFSTAAGI